MMGRLLVVAAVLGFTVGCSPSGPPASAPVPDADAIRVVTTTTVFADLVARVGGRRVAVTSLVPRGGDVHTFDPSPGAMTAVAEADLVVANGLGLDDWLMELARDAGAGDVAVVALGEELEGVDYLAADSDDEHGAGDDGHGDGVNPHLWLDVANARLYADRIAGALAEADPEHRSIYVDLATRYDRELAELDGWIRERIGTIPEADRKLVSFHEAFPYLAEAYGLEIVGVVVDSPGQDPSAGEIAALIEAIRAAGVKAVFSESQFSDRLARGIAEDAGATVESDLYSDTLGEPPADSYVGMMRHNVERIVGALR